jgi:hypothetical protein
MFIRPSFLLGTAALSGTGTRDAIVPPEDALCALRNSRVEAVFAGRARPRNTASVAERRAENSAKKTRALGRHVSRLALR